MTGGAAETKSRSEALEERHLKSAEESFLNLRDEYLVTGETLAAPDGGRPVTRVSLRLPDGSCGIDILIDGDRLFYTGDMSAFFFRCGEGRSAAGFFARSPADPCYWREKLLNPEAAEVFDYDVLEAEALDYAAARMPDGSGASDGEITDWLDAGGDALQLYEDMLERSAGCGRLDWESAGAFASAVSGPSVPPGEWWVFIRGMRHTFRYLFCCHVIRWVSGLLERGRKPSARGTRNGAE